MQSVPGKLFFVFSIIFSAPVLAHFQLIYTPDVNLKKVTQLPLKLIFWHPMSNGQAMDMEQPEAFFYVYRGKRIDLLETLKPIVFQGTQNSAAAYESSIRIKRNGDYGFVLIPTPFYETTEDKYIQQITKSYINKGELPTDWNEPIGLATEIMPLNKPYGAIVGSTFSGIVLADGKPVASAEIEIEYIAAEPDMRSNRAGPASLSLPGGALVVISDDNGKFTFGVPRAGFWGFAALNIGPATEYQGKELSQDAVLWIRAYDLE